MKYLKKFNILIREFVETYDIKSISGDEFVVKYQFTDIENNRYLVQFKNDTVGTKKNPILGNSYELTYYVWDDEVGDWNVNKIVNSNVWRVLHTIFGVVLEDFILKHSWVNSIRLEGLAKEREKEFITQRTKLYLRHLKNNPINGFRIENWGNNRINLIRNKK